MQDHAQILNKYIYIYTPLPVSRVFGARSGSPRINIHEASLLSSYVSRSNIITIIDLIVRAVIDVE